MKETQEHILLKKAQRRQRNIRSFETVSFYALCLVVFFAGLFPLLATFFLMVSAFFWAIRWIIDIKFSRQSLHFLPFSGALIVFLIMSACSILMSPDVAFSFYNWTHLVGFYAIAYFLTSQVVHDEKQLRVMTFAFGLSAFFIVIYGFFQFYTGIDTSAMKWVDGNIFPELNHRIFSTWENPNIYAGYLNEVICLLFAFFISQKKFSKLGNFIYGVAFIALFVSLALTYARGACLSLVIVLACYGVIKDFRVLFVLLLACVAMLYFNPVLAERIASSFSSTNMMDTSAEMRLAMWESTVNMILDHPLLGIGWGAYWLVYPAYDFYIVDGSVTIYHAHNMYLNYFAEVGLIGGCAFFIYFLGTMFFSFHERNADAIPFVRSLRLGLGLALMTIAVGGLTDAVIFNYSTSLLLWIMCASSMIAYDIEPDAVLLERWRHDQSNAKGISPVFKKISVAIFSLFAIFAFALVKKKHHLRSRRLYSKHSSEHDAALDENLTQSKFSDEKNLPQKNLPEKISQKNFSKEHSALPILRSKHLASVSEKNIAEKNISGKNISPQTGQHEISEHLLNALSNASMDDTIYFDERNVH